MAITFDTSNAPELVIVLDPLNLNPTAAQIYTAWKDWVLTGAGSGIFQAFDTVGNDEIDAAQGLFTDANFFFRNDLGWRLRPPEANGYWNIVGNFLPRDPATQFRIPTIGNFNTGIDRTVSAIVFEKQIDTGSGLTALQAQQLAEMWRLMGLDIASPMTATQASIVAGSINIALSGDGVNVSTAQRQ